MRYPRQMSHVNLLASRTPSCSCVWLGSSSQSSEPVTKISQTERFLRITQWRGHHLVIIKGPAYYSSQYPGTLMMTSLLISTDDYEGLEPCRIGTISAKCQNALNNLVLLILVKDWLSNQLLKIPKQFHITFISTHQPQAPWAWPNQPQGLPSNPRVG